MHTKHLAGVLLATAACAWYVAPARARNDETYSFTSQRVLPVTRETRLEVANRSGEIAVVPSTDGRVTVSIEKRITTRDRAEAERIEKMTTVETGSAGGVISVRVKYPRISRKFGIFHIDALGLNEEVVLAISAPPSLDLAVNTASGNVVIRGMRGAIDLEMTSGDAEIVNAGGAVECSVTSGDLEVRGAVGPVEIQGTSCGLQVSGITKATILHTSSGDITGRGLGAVSVKTASGMTRLRDVGAIDVQSSSGDVSIVDAQGRARVRTVSGECDLDLAPRPGDTVDLSTTSGDITVRVPASLGYDVSASTTSGTITSRLPMRVRTATRRELSGRVGRGGVSLSATTVSGTIMIDRGGETIQ